MSTTAPPAEARARSLPELETPCLLLDIDRLERNCERMLTRAQALGVQLRPHLKTAKSVEVAQRATGGAARGITVSTLKEADYFARHGYSDIVCATAVVPAKLAHAARIRETTGCELILVTDALAVVREAARFAVENRTRFSFVMRRHRGACRHLHAVGPRATLPQHVPRG
jgi:D-serine deaminase-like pyridoxal phosphate-dependent protein